MDVKPVKEDAEVFLPEFMAKFHKLREEWRRTQIQELGASLVELQAKIDSLQPVLETMKRELAAKQERTTRLLSKWNMT